MKYYKRKSISIIFLFVIIFNIFLFEIPAHSEISRRKNVLILNSYNKGNDLYRIPHNNWCDEIISGIESKFKDNKESLNLTVEYMNSSINFSDEYYDMLYNLYKYKFNNTKYDAIIALDDSATDFLIKYGDDLFPNIPVVFSGVAQSKQSIINTHPLYTGIYKNQDFKSTLDIALEFHPNTKHFFIILDKTSKAVTYNDQLRQLVHLYEDRVDFLFCNDQDIDVVKEKIDALSKDTVIFTSAQFKDSSGTFIPLAEVNNILFKDSPLPIYSQICSYLNNGIVGGMTTDGAKLGVSLGEITSRILNGETPNHIPTIVDNAHEYTFDFNQLKRFNINMSSVPKDSIIINKPLCNNYSIPEKVVLYFTVGFILLLISTIIFLLTMIRKLNTTKRLLSDSESLLKTIINSTPDIICFKDPNGLVLQSNNSNLDLLNIEKDYKFKHLSEIINMPSLTEKDFINMEKYDNKAWESGNFYRTEEVFPYEKEDIFKTYDIIRIPLFNKDKTRKGLLLFGRDITDHKANEKNKKIIEELKYYDKLRIEFFTNLSHELRTPLTVIFSSIQVIDGMLNNNTNSKIELDKINKYTDIMKQNCYRLLRLMNNFMDLSKIDSGYFPVEFQNMDIINVVESIVLSIADYIESKNLSIIFDTDIEEKIISCDPNIIERVILNLLSNSIKFTPSGGSISVNIFDKKDSITISIKDTGIGIPIEKQAAIFEKFVQVDKSLSRVSEGSGIGLSLVTSLVKLLDGTITLISKPNQGSEFTIEIPAKPLIETNVAVENYNIAGSKIEMIKMEFSDIYN